MGDPLVGQFERLRASGARARSALSGVGARALRSSEGGRGRPRLCAFYSYLSLLLPLWDKSEQRVRRAHTSTRSLGVECVPRTASCRSLAWRSLLSSHPPSAPSERSSASGDSGVSGSTAISCLTSLCAQHVNFAQAVVLCERYHVRVVSSSARESVAIRPGVGDR